MTTAARHSSGGKKTLFDFNGVLVNDEHVHRAAFREVVRPLGIDLTEEMYVERYLGLDDAGAFRKMLADAGKPAGHEDVARLIEAKKPVYMSRIRKDGLVVMDGAVDLVRRRASIGRVGVVSGALRHEIEYGLGVMGVREHVSFIVSAEDARACKPDPEGYKLGLRALRREGEEQEREPHAPHAAAVALEDSLAGVIAAKEAGLRCAAITSSYSADRLKAAGADVVVTRLVDLTDALFDGDAKP